MFVVGVVRLDGRVHEGKRESVGLLHRDHTARAPSRSICLERARRGDSEATHTSVHRAANHRAEEAQACREDSKGSRERCRHDVILL